MRVKDILKYSFKRIFYISVILIFLILFSQTPNLLAHEKEEIKTDCIIQHTPVSFYSYKEKLKIRASVKQEVEWVRFFFRSPGVNQFEVRDLEKKDNGRYIYELDPLEISTHEFEYYLAVRKGNQINYYPVGAPSQLMKVTGKGEEPVGKIPKKIPATEKKKKKFKLPFSINGSNKRIIFEKETDDVKTTASGNLRTFYSFQSKDTFSVNINLNICYTNTPLPEENQFDLPKMILSVSKNSHNLKAGDLNINESEYTIYGLGKRGIEYIFDNKKAYFHIFSVSSQQLKGFDGIGIPEEDNNILGGVLGYNFFNNTISFKMIYLTGKDDPSQGSNIGLPSTFQERKGNVLALVNEIKLFKNKLSIKGEFARSSYDNDLTDDEEAVSDNAWKIDGIFSLGKFFIGANYRYIGKDFNSIGYQFFTNNRQGYRLLVGYTGQKFNINGIYLIRQDNVVNDPDLNTNKNKNAKINFLWKLSKKISVNLSYYRDNQDTFEKDPGTSLRDSISNGLSAGLNLNLGKSSSITVSFTNSQLNSDSNPERDVSSSGVNFFGIFRAGKWFFLSSSLGFTKSDHEFTDTQTLAINAYLTSELFFVPRVFSLQLTGSYYKTELPSSDVTEVLNLGSGFNFYLDKLIKIGSIILSLKGNYKSTENAGNSVSDYKFFFQGNFSF